jgi:hypothetical protein
LFHRLRDDISQSLRVRFWSSTIYHE